jgi:hypothetical protein
MYRVTDLDAAWEPGAGPVRRPVGCLVTCPGFPLPTEVALKLASPKVPERLNSGANLGKVRYLYNTSSAAAHIRRCKWPCQGQAGEIACGRHMYRGTLRGGRFCRWCRVQVFSTVLELEGCNAGNYCSLK